MISNEASASELAISNAITRPPSRDAPPDETRSSGARPVCAPALAKIPPATMGAAALRSDPIRSQARRRSQILFPAYRADPGPSPHFSTHVYHILLSSANAKPDV